jgi:hypothetical protein
MGIDRYARQTSCSVQEHYNHESDRVELAQTAISNILIDHLVSGSSSSLFVYPGRLEPMLARNQTKLHFGVGQHGDPSSNNDHSDTAFEQGIP